MLNRSSNPASTSTTNQQPMMPGNSKCYRNNDSRSIANATKQTLPDIDAKIYGFRQVALKAVLYYTLCVMTCGFLFIVGKFWPRFHLRLVCVKCPLKFATLILIKDINGAFSVCNVHNVSVNLSVDTIMTQTELSDEELLAILHGHGQPPVKPSCSFSSTDSSDANSDNELIKPTGSKGNHKRNKLSSLFKPSSPSTESIIGAEELVSFPSNTSKTTTRIRYFEYHQEKFVLDEPSNLFYNLTGLTNMECQDFREMKGNSSEQDKELTKIYGTNNISVVVKNYCQLFIDAALNPFYLFQLGSISVWSLDEYYLYAICVCIIAFLSIIASIRETKEQMSVLKQMAEGQGESMVTVQRPNGDVEDVMASELVPGSVMLIPSQGFIVPCDAVMTLGACIVNESMLTGESIPVHKTAVTPNDEEYDTESFKRNTLYCGTQVIQTKCYAGVKARCVVIRTGFNTAKGSLIRSIIYPKEVSFSFRNDAQKFVGILFGIALLAMIYTCLQYLRRHASGFVTTIRVLDTLTIAVPPALPAALSIGSYYAQIRLKLRKIFCTSPDRINFAGKIKLFCFDKTGTLTEGGLDLWCVVPCNLDNDGFDMPVTDPSKLHVDSYLLRGMASCHSLTYINGELVGDPLDVKMFESTKWELEEPFMYQNKSRRHNVITPTVVKKGMLEMGILRQFEFTPQLQRMSVVVRAITTPQQMELFCKGSPEKVLPLCNDVPENYQEILDSFTIKGYRVLALAAKTIVGLSSQQLQKISRSEIETDLNFFGFIVLQNCLKPATKSVINKLSKGGIRSVMVTGDNMLTAVSVARECHMVSPSEKIIIVDLNEENELEFRLTARPHEDEDPSTSVDIHRESNSVVHPKFNHEYVNVGGGPEYANVNIGGFPEYVNVGTENRFNGSMDDITGSGSDILDEVAFLHQCQSDSMARRRIYEHGAMTGNSTNTSTKPDTFIDMNNHVVQLPSSSAIIPAEELNYADHHIKQIGGTTGVLNQLSNADYHFVMTGKAWAHIYQNCPKEVLNKILVKGTVFARMNPENKRQLVEAFQGIGYCVGMCGDGANDCAALKMAHVGISLSDAEASVAAPFTSKVGDISCVEALVLEGRCALVTSFGMFKYMALYSMVQLCTVLILYTKGTNLADAQFLFIDLGIITTLAIAMGRTSPSTKLVNQRPMAKLLSLQNFISIIFQIFLGASCQIAALLYLQHQPWFVPVTLENPDEKFDRCWETTTLFHVSCFQYIIISLALSKGKPFRKAFYTNWLLVGVYIACALLSLMLLLFPFPPLQEIFHLMPWKFDETFGFRFKILAIPMVNLVGSYSFERLMDNRNYLKKMLNKLGWAKKKFEYEEIAGQVENDLSWPPIKTG